MLSALDTPTHRHTAWPAVAAGWCAVCSARLDWWVHFLDNLLEKEHA